MSVQIRKATIKDVEAIRRMHAVSWLATYPNDEHQVSVEWIKQETDGWLTPEGLEGSIKHFEKVLGSQDHFYRIAVDDNRIVGFIHALKEDDIKKLGGFYLLPEYLGMGLAQSLMSLADEWFGKDPVELEVAPYNTRAIRFYEKKGFSKVPNSDSLFKGKIPGFTMRREQRDE